MWNEIKDRSTSFESIAKEKMSGWYNSTWYRPTKMSIDVFDIFEEKYHQKEKTDVDTNLYLAIVVLALLTCCW